MGDRHRDSREDSKTPPVDTRLEALAHRLDWIERDRLSIRHQLWVWMAEHLLAVSGAMILGGFALGASGLVAWDAVFSWLDTFLSGIVGILAVLTVVARIGSFVADRRERTRANRSLIETSVEDDP